MTVTDFEIVAADWPEKVSPTRKAITDFIASDLDSAEIKGDESFIQNVVRLVRTNNDFKNVVECRIVDKRLYIRRKANA